MDTNDRYQDTLDYLYSYIDYSLKRRFRYAPEKFDLGRMRDFMELVGNPQDEYEIIHIAGTKGKGSVSAITASIYQQSGRNVGLYTSPHLIDYTERIRFNGDHIKKEELIDLVDEIRPILDKGTKLTTFEITTALALMYFSKKGADIAVLEVGLGGRLDATNIVTPLITAITKLSYDHTEFLGDTIQKIAREKGGIIKPGIPVVLSPQEVDATLEITNIAEERQSPLIAVDDHYQYEVTGRSLDSQSFLLKSKSRKAKEVMMQLFSSEDTDEGVLLSMNLLGDHQVENAVTSLALIFDNHEKGLLISEESIREGLMGVDWIGRFQILHRDPILVVDSAHNQDSAKRLSKAVKDYFHDKNLIVIIGASEDKDVKSIYSVLLPGVDLLITTRSMHPRSMDPGKLADLASGFAERIFITQTIEEALETAFAQAQSESVILVAGSVFVAGAALNVWKEDYS